MLSMGNNNAATSSPKPLSPSSSVVVDTPAKLRFLGRGSSFEVDFEEHPPLSPSTTNNTSPHQRLQYLASFADIGLLQRTPTKQKAE